MTNNLKCPFCGAYLKEGNNDIVMSCFDTEPCPCYNGFKRQVYKALIDGKKAQDMLKDIEKEVCLACVECVDVPASLTSLWIRLNKILDRINLTKPKDNKK